MEQYHQITIDEWLGMKESLKEDLTGVQESFVRIGYKLRKIKEQRLYEKDGYKSIAEFAAAEYGLTASTVSRFIAINMKYSVGGKSEQLRPEFADLGSSKLSEMLSLPDADLEMIRPEATRESIRELKNFNKTEPKNGTDGITQLVEAFFKENPELLRELSENGLDDERKAAEIINPGGNRVFRKGAWFMMMYENDIKVKKFGGVPESLGWARFLEITAQLSDGRQQDERTGAGGNTEGDERRDGEGLDGAGNTGSGGSRGDGICRSVEREDAGSDSEADSRTGNAAGTGRGGDDGAAGETGAAGTDDNESAAGDDRREEPAVESPIKVPSPRTGPETGNTGEYAEPEAEEGQSQGTEAEETAVIIEEPFGTRKDYIDTLTCYGAADYMAAEYRAGRLRPEILGFQIKLEEWLSGKVDERGRPWLEDDGWNE